MQTYPKSPRILKANHIYFGWKNYNIRFQSGKETQEFLRSECVATLGVFQTESVLRCKNFNEDFRIWNSFFLYSHIQYSSCVLIQYVYSICILILYSNCVWTIQIEYTYWIRTQLEYCMGEYEKKNICILILYSNCVLIQCVYCNCVVL